MNLELCLAIAALVIQAAALMSWIALRRKVERWVWVMVLLGFLIMAFHRVGEVFNYNIFPQFTHFTAILIAVIALISVLQTRHWIRKRERFNAGLAVVQTKLEKLAADVENRPPIATRIAEILNELREQLDFYEAQAKRHHLPTFKNGGTDRTRSG